MKTVLGVTIASAVVGWSVTSFATPFNLDDQTVTATRTATQGIAATSVFRRADIERLQANSVPDLLRRVPGINITNTGGPGKNTNISIRGSNSNQVLVLIDGIRVGSATTGEAAFQNLPIELIERVEVVRGPRSSLYGSEAIGGVIQIFTRRGDQDGIKPYVSATAGSRNHHAGSAGVSGSQGNAWYNLGVSSLDTRGIDARPGAPASSLDPDHDGYRELAVAATGGYRFGNGLEVDAQLLEARSHNDYDSGARPYADNVLKTYSARARFAPLEPWQLSLQVGRSEDETDTFANGEFNTRIDTRRDSISWQNDITLAEGQLLTVGYDYLHDSVNGTTVFREDSRDNHAVYAQYLGERGRHEWQLGLRRDDNEEHGIYNTGSIGYGYALAKNLRATASYGTAYKAPTFNQLYHPFFGNADINEETSRSLEAGLEGRQRWGSWTAVVFRNEIDELIAYFNQGDGLRAYNIDQAVIKGVELGADGQWQGWNWYSSLTLQDPANRSERTNQGDLLPRRPEQIFNLDVDRRFGNVGAGASLHVEGRRWDNAANSNELSGYNTVELRTEYWLSPAWRVQARLTNLFDSKYETARTYQQQGRAGYLTVRYQAL
ncbi:MAG TPA: TonB-dependent vitamin B12 receptor [Pseudomonas xinjiangensis]|uniref:TonB-dependent vitamin B12 receptor n=2 Tax=root TaxID=1 RepID=A0A7V1FSF6_9GAMM|nr:TonB-dependent vitamin B12 receptor [Halopseudomonas xinjiangensis]HEC46161.1 TonB-dependent vitamin B12 receptor [Halopseudomonas xinjiangensis]